MSALEQVRKDVIRHGLIQSRWRKIATLGLVAVEAIRENAIRPQQSDNVLSLSTHHKNITRKNGDTDLMIGKRTYKRSKSDFLRPLLRLANRSRFS